MMRGFDCAAVSTPYIEALKAEGMEFAARYYRRNGATNPFDMERPEAEALSKAGFWLVSVFQNFGNALKHFTIADAEKDARHALAQAERIGQPIGSGIYFAVDFNPNDFECETVLDYFNTVRLEFMQSGYGIGVYGSGMVCRKVRENYLAQHVWLTNALGWRETRTFQDWMIKQSLPIKLDCGLEIDPNVATDPVEAGMWRYDGV